MGYNDIRDTPSQDSESNSEDLGTVKSRRPIK